MEGGSEGGGFHWALRPRGAAEEWGGDGTVSSWIGLRVVQTEEVSSYCAATKGKRYASMTEQTTNKSSLDIQAAGAGQRLLAPPVCYLFGKEVTRGRSAECCTAFVGAPKAMR